MLSAFVRVPDVSKERALSPLLALDLVGEMDGARFIPLGGLLAPWPVWWGPLGLFSGLCLVSPMCGWENRASDRPRLCGTLVLWCSGEYLVMAC